MGMFMNSENPISKLGIIAGGGVLPGKLAQACADQGIMPFMVGLKTQSEAGPVERYDHLWTRLGKAGKIISTLKSKGIQDLVLIGSIRRPSLAELRPDWWAAKFFARAGLKALGDNDLLSLLREALENEGFCVHGAHRFMADLLAPEEVLTKVATDEAAMRDIRRGFEVSQVLGALDVGQAAVVQEGLVLGVEGIEGTDGLIARCAALKREGRGPVLVKSCKPQQDQDLDMPTIGPETALKCAEAGFSGIAVQAGATLLVDLEQVIEIADQNGMFVIGVNCSPPLREGTENLATA